MPKIIAFDEPTASLSDAEIDTLFGIIHNLKQKGIIILYVSHRMKEIFQITDEVVVLKDGKFVCFDSDDWYEVLRFCHFVLSD